MVKIKKIQESGETIYPATIFQAIKNPKNGQTLEKSFESEHKKLTAGFAYEILGDEQATDEQFSFRPTGGPNRNVRDGSARIEVLKGNSVVWNQLFPTSTKISDFNFVGNEAVYEGGRFVITISPNLQNNTIFQLGYSIPFAYHKWLIISTLRSAKQVNIKGFTTVGFLPNQKCTILAFYNSNNNNSWYHGLSVDIKNAPTTVELYDYKIIDLTKMFGAGNEPTTIEQFYELLPEGVDINAYNEGEIVDANYKAIKTTGFNLWNEQWENGKLDSSNGNEVAGNGWCSGFIRVLGGIKYSIAMPEYLRTSGIIVFEYASNKVFIRARAMNYANMGSYPFVFGTADNAAYLRITDWNNSTYNNDICINLAWDEYSALNGTYKPYKPFERDLSWVGKYFPATINGETKYGMRRAGNVADEIRFNSTTQQWEAVQKVGVRAYQSGDEANTAVTTDGKNTNYALATPDVKTITEDVNLAYDVADYGAEQLIVADGTQSAPLSAKVVYEPNVLASIKQVAAMLTRLDALETAVATMQASAVATTNEE